MDPGKDLVAISEAIDELCLKRFIGEERAAIDRFADLGFRQFSALGDPTDDLPGYRGEQRVHLLAMRGGHPGFG